MPFPSIPDIQLSPGKKIYFLSDFHLGIPDASKSRDREKKICSFLETIAPDAAAVFIMGDLFDFWFEYRQVVPKGYTRILGKLADLSDRGVALHFFVGNHDMWMRDYFQKELNMQVYYEAHLLKCKNKLLLLGHGDGLGPGDHGYKFLKRIFRNPFCKWLFGILPPVIGVGIARYFSMRSRLATGITDDHFKGEDKERLVQFCREQLLKNKVHYFIFGHRHLPIEFDLTPESRYVNVGDWIRYFTYAVFDGEQVFLNTYAEQP